MLWLTELKGLQIVFPSVLCHCRDADFGSCTGQPTHRRMRMSEDTIFDRREEVFDGASAQPHRFWRHTLLHPIWRAFVQMASQAPSRKPACSVTFSVIGPASADRSY